MLTLLGFWQMLSELNRILDRHIDPDAAQAVRPTYSGYNGFLNQVVLPIYNLAKAVSCTSPGDPSMFISRV